MTTSQKPFSERPFFQRQYRRFMDWLWFGPLTRDLHPAPYPSRLRSACGRHLPVWLVPYHAEPGALPPLRRVTLVAPPEMAARPSTINASIRGEHTF